MKARAGNTVVKVLFHEFLAEAGCSAIKFMAAVLEILIDYRHNQNSVCIRQFALKSENLSWDEER